MNEDFNDQTGSGITTASEAPFWGDEPESWDTAFVAGIKLPGVCRVKGGVKRKFDRKHTSGRNGPSVTYTGDDAAEFSIVVKVWTPEHLQELAAVVSRLKSMRGEVTTKTSAGTGGLVGTATTWTPSATPKSKFPQMALEVRHPTLSLIGITAAHLIEMSIPEPAGEPSSGIYEWRLGFLEHSRIPDAGQVKTAKTVAAIEDREIAIKPAATSKPSQTNGGL